MNEYEEELVLQEKWIISRKWFWMQCSVLKKLKRGTLFFEIRKQI